MQRLQTALSTRRETNDTVRIRDLSEQLLLKQTALETANNEKRALQLQLEMALQRDSAMPEIVVTSEDGGPEGAAEVQPTRVFENLAQGGTVQQAMAKLASMADIARYAYKYWNIYLTNNNNTNQKSLYIYI